MDKLTDFGHTFQIKSISALMKNQTFLEQIHDILDEKHYDSDALKWIVKECKKYYDEYRKCITLDVFKVKTQEVENDVLKLSIIESLKEVFRHLESPDLDFIEDKALDFFKNQTLKSAIVQSVEIMEAKGDFEQIKRLVDDALNAGTERNIGHEYSELGVIVAPAGVGKTWVLAAIGANAMKRGKHIVHYSLELNESYVGLRYDSIFTGIANQNLKYHKDDVISEMDKLKGDLVIKYYPTKSASVNTLSAHLKRITTLGTEVDMVIVDYADILKDTGSAREVRHALGNIYEDLRGLAGEFQIPIWTASQANRSALDEDVIEAQKVSESYQKIMTADFVMSLSRKVEDKIGNTGRFHVIKNRFGPDGMTFPSKINTNTGKMEIYEGNSVGGKEQQDKINNRDNLMKKMLSNRYEDLMNE